jgi:hypothetical protein
MNHNEEQQQILWMSIIGIVIIVAGLILAAIS